MCVYEFVHETRKKQILSAHDRTCQCRAAIINEHFWAITRMHQRDCDRETLHECVYAYMYEYIYMCVYECMYTCMHVHMSIYIS